ncbi:hypothetical protein [Mesorhizobium sp. L-8-3]|uniref:hypothetical protein n=1 Tax=Mesorhizobium sp. L-8-3 TaxID=2744522 RepID=UPI0019269972|nr:hypothetical protein [Mesorhizobium sp. L-8-3]BCH24172.1 hypothetical protein MesoLjLb_39570 [Mesorhizobium sp. L-8-3]
MAPSLIRVFEADGIPNSALPLVIWKDRLPGAAREGGPACALYRRNGWSGTWVYTVYPFWHFHTHGHEVLGCVGGRARIGFGGDAGIVIDVERGDVAVVPAGVGHRKIQATDDFLMAGGYPPGQQGNIVRSGELDDKRIAAEIGRVGLPESDPVTGLADGVVTVWRRATS